MEKKITKVQKFTDIKHLLNGEDTEFGLTLEQALEAIDHEMELIANKNKTDSKAKTAKAEANAELKAEVLNLMEVGKDYSSTDILKALLPNHDDMNIPRITYVMGLLIADGAVDKTTNKRKVIYTRH